MSVKGISHVGLTVSNLEVSREWYAAVLQWQPQVDGETADTRFSSGQLPDGTAVVLRQHNNPAGPRFDERQPGLDHLSIACSELGDIDALIERLTAAGATWSPVQSPGWGHILNFRDPDNIALEYVAPA